MIQERTRLVVADNSGARSAMCIRILGGTRRRCANVGDLIKVAVKESAPRGKVRKGEVSRAVVVRSRRGIRRRDGSVIRFGENACVLLADGNQLVGTRIFGVIPRELREGFAKLLSLAPEVL